MLPLQVVQATLLVYVWDTQALKEMLHWARDCVGLALALPDEAVGRAGSSFTHYPRRGSLQCALKAVGRSALSCAEACVHACIGHFHCIKCHRQMFVAPELDCSGMFQGFYSNNMHTAESKYDWNSQTLAFWFPPHPYLHLGFLGR